MKEAAKAPDPYEVARQQAQMNLETAQATQRMGMTSQDTAYGSVRYVADPTAPSGYRVVTSLSPEQQKLLEQSQGIQGQYGDLTQQQVARVAEAMGKSFSLDAARGAKLSDINRTMMDPQWQQQQQGMEADLLNRGIRPGSEAYTNAMRQFGQQKSDAYNRMYLDSYNTANNAALTERNLPMSDLASLGGMAAPQQMHSIDSVNAPTATVANTDLSSNVYKSAEMNAQAQKDAMGGAFGAASTIGGWAMKALPLMMSDRRLKTDVVKLGDDPRGWSVYSWRYVWDAAKRHVGFMADEVPEWAVVTLPGGWKAINYGAL